MIQIFSKLLSPKNPFPLKPKSSCFGTRFGSQSVLQSQTLLKSARHTFYPNFSLIEEKLSWETSP